MLEKFESETTFIPTMHPERTLRSPFAVAYQKSTYRFDVGKIESERNRLLRRRLEIVECGVKRSIQYLNDDLTQIPRQTHRVEQQSFAMVRDACFRLNVRIERVHEDAYTSVDCRVDKTRIQDRVCGAVFSMRNVGGHPIDPDRIDVFQVTNLEHSTAYAIAMRKREGDDVVSTFSERELMSGTIPLTKAWKSKHSHEMHNLETIDGIKNYIIINRARMLLRCRR